MPEPKLIEPHYNLKNLKHARNDLKAALLEQVKNQYWHRGALRYKCFPGGQTQLYDRVHEQAKRFPGVAEPLVALAHRRFGKSHMSALLCVERCLAQPGAEVHFGTDTKNHARKILEEKLFETFRDMPKFITYRKRDNCYWFRNTAWAPGAESMLVLEGLDYNLGGGMRGGAADLFIIDEAREIRNLEYVVKSVVTPMFKGRPSPTLVMCTTPPDSMDHDFTRIYVANARVTDSLIVIPASKNPDWTEDDTKLMLQQYRSKKDVGWRRELECELISDPTRMIVPEWGAVRPRCIVSQQNRPAYYSPYVSIDTGWKDHSAAILAYYDFVRNKIVVVDEIFLQYTPTEDFAEILVDKIITNFPSHLHHHLRIQADGNGLNIADLNKAISKISDFWVREPAERYDREAAINNMRSGIQSERILVESQCQELDKQLLNGLWNPRRTSFDRSKDLGHCDVLACLIYLYRNIRWGENVFPSGDNGWQEGKCRIPEETVDVPATGDAETLRAIFNVRKFR